MKSKPSFVTSVKRPSPISSRENALKDLLPELPWVASSRGGKIYTTRKNLTLSRKFGDSMQDACLSDPALTHKCQHREDGRCSVNPKDLFSDGGQFSPSTSEQLRIFDVSNEIVRIRAPHFIH